MSERPLSQSRCQCLVHKYEIGKTLEFVITAILAITPFLSHAALPCN